ncbi:MAG: ATP-binding cassette domain-containing protein [Parcubacteria group bacterium]|nr:ATP-binding cassette domain-containing protein [Parcubacteria group bacterium]
MSNPLREYINQARNHGLKNEEIIEELQRAGWQVHDILDLVAEPAYTPSTGESIISVRGVSKTYDGKAKLKALDNVSLDITPGQVTALLGPNGAGKTTLVRIMATLLLPTSGSVRVAGLDVVNDAQQLRSIIGLAGQYAAVDEILSGRENLEMFGRLYHLSKAEAKARAKELLAQFQLEDTADRPLKTYSGGMRRRLDLAASLVIRPKVLFLDEPTTGLDPRSRFGMWNVIRDLVADGTTVLLTTQYLEEADQLARTIFVIDRGRIITKGTSDELKNQVGGDILELHVANHAEAGKAAEAIKSFGSETPQADEQTGIVTLPVSGGASVLVDAVRKLDAAQVKLMDIRLRRPSLDDVFMKLTGHSAE